jgi:hypothetical protein
MCVQVFHDQLWLCQPKFLIKYHNPHPPKEMLESLDKQDVNQDWSKLNGMLMRSLVMVRGSRPEEFWYKPTGARA